MFVFITGGVRSGKSSFAEKKVYSFMTENKNQLMYVATSKRYDPEMNERINKHQNDRQESGFQWQTLEKSTDVNSLLGFFSEHSIVLLDCLTTLVANELFQDLEKWHRVTYQSQMKERILSFVDALKIKGTTTIIVSNELLNSGLNYDEATLVYMKLIGELHQQLVKKADLVYLVEAGIPLEMKGCE